MIRPRNGSIVSLASINGNSSGGIAATLPAVLDVATMTTVSVVPADEETVASLSLGEKLGHITRTTSTVAAGDTGASLITEKLKDVLLPTVTVREITDTDDSSSDDSANNEQCDEEKEEVKPTHVSLASSQDKISDGNKKTTTIAFAFDIDGVLLRSKTPLPGARSTILKLQRLRIPFIFLTNGGGHTEAAHVAQLGNRLSLPSTQAGEKGCLREDQFVQSHTPFRNLVGEYRDKTVLALGGAGNGVRDLAEAYGFGRVVTSSDLFAAEESIHPFSEMTRQSHLEHARSLRDVTHDTSTESIAAVTKEKKQKENEKEKQTPKISAILVFSSPRDWCLDLQLIVDLLLSAGGVLGTRSPKNGDKTLPNRGFLQDDQPKLFFCNPDFEWATSHPLPRFAQGAFREALEGVWRFATRDPGGGGGGGGASGSEKGEDVKLEYTICGKPTDTTYVYGEKVLQAYNERLLHDKLEHRHDHDHDHQLLLPSGTTTDNNGDKSDSESTRDKATDKSATAARHCRCRDITHVYMIGDNPESDVSGANAYKSRFGTRWESILVETGVYVAGTEPTHAPGHIARDVQSAVDWALAQHERVD